MSAEFHPFFNPLPESNLRQATVYGQADVFYDARLDDHCGQPTPIFSPPVRDQTALVGARPDPAQSPAPGRLAGEPAYCGGRHCCQWSVDGCACNNHYPSAKDLDKHVATDHAGRHPGGEPSGDYHCHWAGCSKSESFGNKPKLTRHIHSHTGHKPHQCVHPGCAKGFVTKEQLKNHETTHTKTKEHVCPECGKGFAVKTALTSHMNVHKGAKPYVCDECGKGFADSSNLSKHKAIHKRVAVKKHRHAAHRSSISSTSTCLYSPPPTMHTYHHLAEPIGPSVEPALCSRPCYDVQCADGDRVPCRSVSPCLAAPCNSTDCEQAAFESCSMPQCDLPDCDFQPCDLPDCFEDCLHFCDGEHYDPGFCASEDELCGRPPPPSLEPSFPSQPSHETTPAQRRANMQASEFDPEALPSSGMGPTFHGLEGMEFATTEGFKQLHDFIQGDFGASVNHDTRFG